MIFTSDIKCTLLASCASDLDVVNAARVSFNDESQTFQDADAKLISYLVRNRHGSPFEHGYFKFLVEAPMFVFREHHRHRVGHSYNEMSGRYTELEPKFYVPQVARVQKGKPGAYEYEDSPMLTQLVQSSVQQVCADAWVAYQSLLMNGVAKEQARIVLPVNTYSKMIWSGNPRSLMHYLSLRGAKDAMFEIKEVARQAEEALLECMPSTYSAFVTNDRKAP